MKNVGLSGFKKQRITSDAGSPRPAQLENVSDLHWIYLHIISVQP